ncbi:hypothetical protein, partial [Pseudoduganella albidiflava]|uniref:hypothetical protein n=1 Tax=Pseudoduganella albidiflava TaxID=321983 RepID=UPI001E312DC4
SWWCPDHDVYQYYEQLEEKVASGAIKVKPMITHRIGLSQWREGFDAMVDKTAIKVIMTYDFDE